MMNKKDHIEMHKTLHKSLDELLADFIRHTAKLPSKTTVLEFLQWSNKQCNPETIEEDK